ncbi:aspartate-semialdehyde dehydrogenase [Falsiroseomonas ponticola]|uniref:aspartate-semialdehyde dehydrogenase n=1 Tax=Falsiroseomonas ponticola TaxID=2786951 RepID=UPI001934B4A5|nr:aspartate-semialdehyde dehydrogenase [Roseomonas ponticola]
MAEGLRVAVGGATGNVGAAMLRVLEERDFPVAEVIPLASAASAGRQVPFRGEALAVRDLARFDFHGTDLLLLSTGAANARETAPRAAAAGCIVIDNSSAFRMDPAVPLVVPEVNPDALSGWAARRILPVANCSTIQLVVALKPLHDAAGLRRVVVSTYQSASGGGRRLMERLLPPAGAATVDMRGLEQEARAALARGGDTPLPFNVVPHIDVFLEDGRTREEWKMEVETRRLLGLPDLPVSATCVRVPVLVAHAEAVTVELERPLPAEAARALLAAAPGIRVVDERRAGGYATPIEVAGRDEVFVSRLREDRALPNGLSLWVVADNVRKGAALNAVQIAEALLRRGDAFGGRAAA